MKKCIALMLLLLLAAAPVLAEETNSWVHESDTLTISVTEFQEKDGNHPLAYYVADVQIKNPSQLRAGFALDKYDSRAKEEPEAIAARNSAALAINGDYYNAFGKGIILRNGEVYRDRFGLERDLLLIDANGDMQIIFGKDRVKGAPQADLTGEQLKADGVLQSYEFGPALVKDGQALTLPTKYFIYTNERTYEPRTAIGQIGPLHYLVLVVDGRHPKWSDRGMTLQNMQDIFLSYGCQTAYNLDGGGSSLLYLDGLILNTPAGARTRQVSDILYFVD